MKITLNCKCVSKFKILYVKVPLIAQNSDNCLN